MHIAEQVHKKKILQENRGITQNSSNGHNASQVAGWEARAASNYSLDMLNLQNLSKNKSGEKTKQWYRQSGGHRMVEKLNTLEL